MMKERRGSTWFGPLEGAESFLIGEVIPTHLNRRII
jgi:hypothetical protein